MNDRNKNPGTAIAPGHFIISYKNTSYSIFDPVTGIRNFLATSSYDIPFNSASVYPAAGPDVILPPAPAATLPGIITYLNW